MCPATGENLHLQAPLNRKYLEVEDILARPKKGMAAMFVAVQDGAKFLINGNLLMYSQK
jgi:hypothetical protein